MHVLAELEYPLIACVGKCYCRGGVFAEPRDEL